MCAKNTFLPREKELEKCCHQRRLDSDFSGYRLQVIQPKNGKGLYLDIYE